MRKHYEGLPAAGNIQESIIQALIDSVTRLAA